MHDLLIRGARIVDGTGAAAVSGDVAVEQGVIREVGRLGSPAARRVVAADGAVVAPGFIDLHTHSDFTLPRFLRAPDMTRQGVTTQVLGNCVFSPFLIAASTAGLLDAVGEAVEIGRRSGAAVQLSHHKAMGRANWGRVRDSLALMERAHASHDVLADQYPYTAASTTLLAVLPGWATAGGV